MPSSTLMDTDKQAMTPKPQKKGRPAKKNKLLDHADFVRTQSDRLFDVLGDIRQVRATVRLIASLGNPNTDKEIDPDDVLGVAELLESKLITIEEEVEEVCRAEP